MPANLLVHRIISSYAYKIYALQQNKFYWVNQLGMVMQKEHNGPRSTALLCLHAGVSWSAYIWILGGFDITQFQRRVHFGCQPKGINLFCQWAHNCIYAEIVCDSPGHSTSRAKLFKPNSLMNLHTMQDKRVISSAQVDDWKLRENLWVFLGSKLQF